MHVHQLFFFKKFSPLSSSTSSVGEGFGVYGMRRIPGVRNVWRPPARPMDPRRRGL
jgi:hypothetical protein